MLSVKNCYKRVGFYVEAGNLIPMGSKRKAPAKKKQRRRWLMPVMAVLLVVVVSSVAYLAVPKGQVNIVPDNVPSGLKDLAVHYMDIMHNLNSTETKSQMAALLNPNYNQTDLFTWESSQLTFKQDTTWYETPSQILNSKQGICVQWSIVYVSACLSLGYQSRLVAAVDTTQSTWNYIHVWAEDYYNGKWVHVDPSDKVWDDPSRYQNSNWGWGSGLGSTVRVYAFEDGSAVDVTSNYAPS